MRQTIKLVRNHPDAVLPTRATAGSFGHDLTLPEDVYIHHGQTKILPTGWSLAAPLPLVEGAHGDIDGVALGGVSMQILPRSSLWLKHGLTIANSPGLVDADYTGPIGIIVHNPAEEGGVSLKKGTRIAQFILVYVDFFPLEEVSEQTQKETRSGFGSTGV